MATGKRFVCPSCTANLNDPDPETLWVRGTLHGDRFTITVPMGLSATLGVYGVDLEDELEMSDGCRVEVSCPHCRHDFTAVYNPDLAEIRMVDEGAEYVVVFSKVFGEHSSYLFDYSTRKLVASYGEDADAYIDELGKNVNFFGS